MLRVVVVAAADAKKYVERGRIDGSMYVKIDRSVVSGNGVKSLKEKERDSRENK